MKSLARLIQKAEFSTFSLWLLNRLMNFSVPFNKPHGFRVVHISSDCVQTFAPYRKKNFNHVRGIHACAIATVGELAAGIMLMYHFSPMDYRLIMSHIEITYHYQAKKDLIAAASLSPADKTAIMEALLQSDKVMQTVVTELTDSDQKSIATVKSTWQIKPWKKVQTKV